MDGKRPTYHELEARYHESISREADLNARIESLEATVDQLRRIIESQDRMLAYYQNSNSPPSANSLEWKRQKREEAKRRRDADESGGGGGNGARGRDGKKKRAPGGQKGHKGVSHKHAPTGTVYHDLDKSQMTCGCGGRVKPGGYNVRDITDIVIQPAVETRHIIQNGACEGCGTVVTAKSDLPARGMYGKNVVKTVAQLRAARVPLAEIARFMNLFDLHMSKSTVINMLARTADAMSGIYDRIVAAIHKSDYAGIDETGMNLGGRSGWAHLLQSGKNVAVVYHKSRGANVMHRYMDGYRGVVTTDGYAVYKMFDPGGRHQLCWAHELRAVRYDALRLGAGPEAGRLYEDALWFYKKGLYLHERAAPSLQLRRSMEDAMLSDITRRYSESDDERVSATAARLLRAVPRLFAFLQYPGADPTNNNTEQELRYVVVFRKISGQIKGGSMAMQRMSKFVSCILTWRRCGLSVAEEVAKIV